MDNEIHEIDLTAYDAQTRNIRHALKTMLSHDTSNNVGIAIFAHEMRNLLCPLKSGLEIIQHRYKSLSEEKLQHMFDVMGRQVTYAQEVIDDLSKSRENADASRLEKKYVKVSELLSQSVEIAQSFIRDKKHQLTVSPSGDIYVFADERRICQVFANLLINAAKYTPDGGSIRLAVRSANDQVIISVQDSGIGISPENITRIFELFHRITPVPLDENDKQSGSGIGLAVAKSIIEAHGGSISAASDGLTMGSTFTVSLPRLERKQLRDTNTKTSNRQTSVYSNQ